MAIWPLSLKGEAAEPSTRLAASYAPTSRAEHLMASTRLALAAFSLFALALHPIVPTPLGWLRLTVVILYSVYAAVLARLVSRTGEPLRHAGAVHATDIGACFLFCSVSEGIGSLFAPFFVFALVAASLRWGWRGVSRTSAAIIGFFVAVGAYVLLSGHAGFEIHSFFLDVLALAVTGELVGRVGAQKQQARRDAEKLIPPTESPGSETDTLRRLAEWAAGIVAAPRVLIAWEEPDEPWTYLVWWERGEFRYTQEPPGMTGSLLPEKLAETNFLCNAVETARPAVLYRSPVGLKTWQGVPLHPTVQARFCAQSILSIELASDFLRGRLFFFDRRGLTVDDLAIAEVVARHITSRLAYLPLLRRSADKTLLDERLRLARDLHDGALHSLGGVALELENLVRTAPFEHPAIQRQLQDVQKSLLEEQRNIRQLIAHLRADIGDGEARDVGFADRLQELACRLKRQWGLRVECVLDNLDSIRGRRCNEVYLIVHEALINAARHANASLAQLEVAVRDIGVIILVADDGRGLALKGRYEQAALAELHLGPTTLRERVALLGGTLAIESSECGTRLEIMLPVEHPVEA